MHKALFQLCALVLRFFLLPYYTQTRRTAFFPLSPTPSKGLCTFTILSSRRDPIWLPPFLYDMHLAVRYDLPGTIHICEPLVRLLVVLVKF